MEKVLYLKTTIEQILNDNKAIDVSSIDLKDKSSIADYMRCRWQRSYNQLLNFCP